MEECPLAYIPDRLKTFNRPAITRFDVGEFLYRRCKPSEIENPFKSITITELSHNRSGLKEDTLCNDYDVLFNINAEEAFEKHVDKVVCTLKIVSLTENNKYRKEFTQRKNEMDYVGVMELIHEPESCMYPHCVFRVWVNDEVVTYDNRKQTIDKLSEIRTRLKEELASMIITKQVNQNAAPSNP